MNESYTDYLTASGSVLLGAASAFAIDGGFFQFNSSGSSEAADARGIHQDFMMIGQDIERGREKFERENQESLCA